MKMAFDGRVAQRPPHSYRRLLDLMTRAADTVGLDYEIWLDGDLHTECKHYADRACAFPAQQPAGVIAAVWSPTPSSVACCDIPAISTVCDINPLLPDGRSRFSRWRRGRRFRSQIRQLARDCWRVATDSQDAYSRLTGTFPELIKKLHVVPLYAAPELKRIADRELNDQLASLGLNTGYILFVGSFRRHKNWHGLMTAYAMCPASLRQQFPLVFSGAVHRDMQHATALMKKLGIDDTTRILGETAERDMAAVYSGASLFVFPTFMEGFGLPPLEAMQCGVPVIATNRTAVPEVLGDAAVYIDPAKTADIAQAIEQVLASPERRHKLIEQGYLRASRFNPQRTGEAILKMISAT